MLRNYAYYKRGNEAIDDKRSESGQRLNSDSVNYYLSEPYQGQGLVVNLEPGQKLLDRFTIKSLLGRGSLGAVYLAADELKSMDVALKVVPVESEFAANQLKNEIRLNSKIVDYNHIIRVYDIHSVRYGGTVMLLVSMEYADGDSLRKWLQDNKDNTVKRQAEALTLFKQACLGIQALHTIGVVHQDVKPENLLFVNGILKISDLGLSRCVHNVQMSDDGRYPDDLEYYSACTPAYAAPEQILAAHPNDVDHRADIHALGAILFEICHYQCRPPFGGTYQQIRQHHLHHVLTPVIENVEPHIARVIARCLQKNLADRYSSVSELLDDLEGKMSEPQSPQDDTGQQLVEQTELLWQQACQLVGESDLSAADRLCSQILSIWPNHDDARCMHEDILGRNEKVREFYKTIKMGIGYQPLDQLISLLNEAIEIYPNHTDAHLVQVQLLSTVTEYEDVMQKGIEALGEGQWQAAQISFERARQLNPGFPAVKRLIDLTREVQMQVETARNNIDAALQQGRGSEAMALAHEVDQYVEEIKHMV